MTYSDSLCFAPKTKSNRGTNMVILSPLRTANIDIVKKPATINFQYRSIITNNFFALFIRSSHSKESNKQPGSSLEKRRSKRDDKLTQFFNVCYRYSALSDSPARRLLAENPPFVVDRMNCISYTSRNHGIDVSLLAVPENERLIFKRRFYNCLLNKTAGISNTQICPEVQLFPGVENLG